MKPTFKTLTSISAVCMTLYVIRRVINGIAPSWLLEWEDSFIHTSIWGDIYRHIGVWLLLASLILALVAVLIAPPRTEPVSKTFKWCTYTSAIFSVITLICAIWTACRYSTYFPVSRHFFLWAPREMETMLALVAAIWLWMLSRMTGIGGISKSLRWGIIVGIGLLCVPLLLQLVSGVAYIVTGHILWLHSGFWFVLFRLTVPTLLICWYGITLCRSQPRQKG